MARSENLSGSTVRGYDLRQQIGVGGFGAVYNAYQQVVDREVAVKVIHSEYANQFDFIRRFEAEARIVARLEHMNIVPLYDFWRDPSGAYLVMRWLRGGSARSALEAHGPWPIDSVVKLLNQISGALSIAHHHGVVHRDIKPENILLDEADNAYLTDFGISVDIFNDPDDILIENLSFGSPAYMSPEQLTQRIATPLADIYSLGILIYELLTAINPFPDETTAALMQKQVRDPIPSLNKSRPELPPALDVVIWRATAKTPAARYQDVMTLASAFQDAASSAMSRSSPKLLNAIERTIREDHRGTAPLSKRGSATENLEIGYGTIGFGDGTVDLGPFKSDDPGGTLDLGAAIEKNKYGTVEFGDSTINLDSVSANFGGTVDFSAELISRNPYKGLRPFEEFDSGDFFGRSELVQLLLDLFEDDRKRFLAVIGPSGSGKSSMIKAGFLPELRQGGVTGSEQWFIVTMVPGDNPFQELSEALLRIAFEEPKDLRERLRKDPSALHEITQELLPFEDAQLLLFIDQFEEIFTQTESEEDRQIFLEGLQRAVTDPESKIRIVITLRADFYDRPLQYAGFGELLRQNTEVLLPLSPAELEDAIIGPAQKAGLIVEPGLSKLIVDDVYRQPGALPLLQYALTELYERRNGRVLEHHAYQDIGGVSGALARRANEIYLGLDAEKKAIARQLFLRLITVEGQSGATRKRNLWAELFSGIANRHAAEAVIAEFAQYRLLTLDRDPVTRSPTIDIAHEALIAEWEQLQTWIEDNRADLQRLQRLEIATNEWKSSGKDPSFLARGTRLADFEALVVDTTLPLNEEQKQYLDESVKLRMRSTQRTRMVIAALATFSIIALIFAILAFDQQRAAEEAKEDALVQRDLANIAAAVSRSRELAATSSSLLGRNDLALLLSVEALQTADTFEARDSLLTALQANPLIGSYMYGHSDPVRSVAYSGDGSMLVSGDEAGNVFRWDGSLLRPVGEPLEVNTGAVNAVDISEDASFLAAGGADGSLYIWDAQTGELRFTPEAAHERAIWSLDISPDGKFIATGDEGGAIILWDAESGDMIWRLDEAHTDIVYDLKFSPDGTVLASASADISVRIWQVESGESLIDPLEQHTNWVLALAYSPNGRLLVSSGADDQIVVYSTGTYSPIDAFRAGHSQWVRDLSFSESGQILATASLDGTVRLWDLAQQQLVTQALSGQRGAIWGVAFHPSELRLVSASADTTLMMWDINLPVRPGSAAILTNQVIDAIVVSPDGTMLASGGENNEIQLWDPQSGESLGVLRGHELPIVTLAFSPDGRTIASSGVDETVRLWDVESLSQRGEALRGHLSPVWAVGFSPDGRIVYASADEGTVIRWDVESGERIGEAMPVQQSGALALAVSPDGRTLAVGGRDASIVLVDAETGEVQGEPLLAHTNAISDLAFNSDGTILASGARDAQIILWDVQSRVPLRQALIGHEDWVLGVSISPDDRILASAGRDNSVILWDLETGRMLGRPLNAHFDWVNAISFGPDSSHLYSAGRDMIIVAWTTGIEEWRQMACRVSNRNLTQNEWQEYFPEQEYREICTFPSDV